MEPENPTYPTMIPNENQDINNLGIANEICTHSWKMQEEDHHPAVIADWRKISDATKTAEKDNNLANGLVFHRANHCTFFYKNFIYFYGGSESPT